MEKADFKDLINYFVILDDSVNTTSFYNSYEKGAIEILDYFLEINLIYLEHILLREVTRDELMMAWIDFVLWIELKHKPVRDS